MEEVELVEVYRIYNAGSGYGGGIYFRMSFFLCVWVISHLSLCAKCNG